MTVHRCNAVVVGVSRFLSIKVLLLNNDPCLAILKIQMTCTFHMFNLRMEPLVLALSSGCVETWFNLGPRQHFFGSKWSIFSPCLGLFLLHKSLFSSKIPEQRESELCEASDVKRSCHSWSATPVSPLLTELK